MLKNLFGGSSEAAVRKLRPLVQEINALEADIQALTDAELRAKTDEFRQRLADGEGMDDILPEAFAVVREASRRYIGMRHFDVQLIGGIVLHQGKIAEMKTGEGKTLVATLPIYLNALEGHGAHLITVNDYLAKRDTQWMGPIYDALGLSVGCLQHESAFLYHAEKVSDVQNMEHIAPIPRRQAYQSDITYGTNNEFGFDYLRDNMATDLDFTVQRERHYAIVDEVDNILIDEARTPLIISGPSQENTQTYFTFARLVPRLAQEVDFTVDEKHRAVNLTEEGMSKLEQWLGVKNIYDPQNYRLTRYMEAALKAEILYKRDRDYVVKDGEVVIVDDFTGRLMFGRRWSDGLHQAVEAKETVKIQQESITYATITLQNYFRLYGKLAGMTGTAWTERDEFFKIYRLDVVVIPTHVDLIRHEYSDFVYRNEESKFRAVAGEIEERSKAGQPLLVGTVSIEKSEYLADLLKRRGVTHQVLNAKFHEKEAGIIAQAGRFGAVTIATNMAGRGTDIILGGKTEGRDPDEWQEEHNKVVDAGGLHIIGTERHEARRIDNQLRGRAGRQGDPGSSRFYVSFEDDIMRRFAPEWLPKTMGRLGMDEDTPIESGMVSKAIETAQSKVEGYNFDIRKHVVEYDDVMNMHRDVIYSERRKILEGADLRSNVLDMVREEICELADTFLPSRREESWVVEDLLKEVATLFEVPPSLTAKSLEGLSREHVLEAIVAASEEEYQRREAEMGEDAARTLERLVMLRVIDSLWVEHLTAMDEMRQGIGLTAYGQFDPLVVYKREAHDMWDQLLANIRRQITHTIYHVQLQAPPPPREPVGATAGRGGMPAGVPAEAAPVAAGARSGGGREAARRPVGAHKTGRNDPCPCGSGKKYKKCCGRAI
ncbi:MAG: preprotein translocase subunit SecA [Dehalococcoidia bacterium]|jgi:preprotein translocase subunit SecA